MHFFVQAAWCDLCNLRDLSNSCKHHVLKWVGYCWCKQVGVISVIPVIPQISVRIFISLWLCIYWYKQHGVVSVISVISVISQIFVLIHFSWIIQLPLACTAKNTKGCVFLKTWDWTLELDYLECSDTIITLNCKNRHTNTDMKRIHQ